MRNLTYTVPLKLEPMLPPQILRFLDWLKQTEGRDKLYRLVAYGSKVPIHVLKTNGGDKETISRLTKGASAVGMTRKLMRMFRALAFLQDILVALESSDSWTERILGMLKSVSLTIWMLIDHTQWAHKAGYLKLENEKQLSIWHSKAWFFGLLFGGLLSTVKYRTLLMLPVNENAKSNADKKGKAIKGIVKNTVDLVIPSQRLGWIPVHDGIVGACGTITSLMGIYETYPKK